MFPNQEPGERDPPWRNTTNIDLFFLYFFGGGPFSPGSWFGNHPTKETPLGEGCLSINLSVWQDTYNQAVCESSKKFGKTSIRVPWKQFKIKDVSRKQVMKVASKELQRMDCVFVSYLWHYWFKNTQHMLARRTAAHTQTCTLTHIYTHTHTPTTHTMEHTRTHTRKLLEWVLSIMTLHFLWKKILECTSDVTCSVQLSTST